MTFLAKDYKMVSLEASEKQKKKIFAMYNSVTDFKNDPERIKEWVKEEYDLSSFNDLTKDQASEVIEVLSKYEKRN